MVSDNWPRITRATVPQLQEHLCSPPVFSGVRVTRFIVVCVCVCFVDRCLSFVFFLSAIYGVVCPLSFFFRLYMVLFVLRSTDCKYPFVSSYSSYMSNFPLSQKKRSHFMQNTMEIKFCFSPIICSKF